jgi:hypothetical protein
MPIPSAQSRFQGVHSTTPTNSLNITVNIRQLSNGYVGTINVTGPGLSANKETIVMDLTSPIDVATLQTNIAALIASVVTGPITFPTVA